jgi:hypothetical protein
MNIKLIITIVLASLALIFVVQNVAAVEVSFRPLLEPVSLSPAPKFLELFPLAGEGRVRGVSYPLYPTQKFRPLSRWREMTGCQT